MENEKTSKRKPEARIPPKRGQVKVKMFKQLKKMVMSVVSCYTRKTSGSNGRSTSTTPPPSSYPSEGHSDA
ncbi:hypothetical protein REPUB_Repub03eG0195000 [Reevesia pubescens]